MLKETQTKIIKDTAKSLGFMACGISKAGFLEDEAPRLENWLKNGMQGEMSWMEQNFDKRLDPTILVPGAKSVVSLLFNYFPEEKPNFEDFKISKYAYGRDYHKVLKKKLKRFVSILTEEIGAFEGRAFVDSAPVMDKAWARKSGLGWMGKHSNIINKKNGSFFFICELICDLDLVYDTQIKDYCGTCTRCIDACPTQAISEPYQVDGSKCISYFTIELKNAIPDEVKGKFENWIFGCDICQDVCPFNRLSKPHQEPDFVPKKELLDLSKSDLIEITDEVFEKVFSGTPVMRTKLSGLKRNIDFLK